MDQDGGVEAVDRAALEAVAFGPDSAPADAARARAELLRRALTTSSPGADAGDAAPILPAGDPSGPAAAPSSRPGGGPVRRPGRWRVGALVVGTAVLAGALGVTGTIVAGRIGPPVVEDGSSDSGSETLTRVLAHDQTAVDALPSAITASVDRSTARLLFANYADRPPVPWVVWVARARSGGDVCFIASPDRYASDVTCVPSAQALHGHVSYVTRDGDQGLDIRVDGGVARIDLIGGD